MNHDLLIVIILLRRILKISNFWKRIQSKTFHQKEYMRFVRIVIRSLLIWQIF